MEFFKILGIDPPRLMLDSSDLERRYYELSLKYHPDRNRSGACSTDLSAKLNEAYKTLKNPWARAEYLLENSGVQIDSKVPPRLAEIYFELQESSDRLALQRFSSELTSLRKSLDEDLRKAFNAFDSMTTANSTKAPGDESEALKILKNLVTEYSYANSMARDLEQKLGGL